VDQPEPLWLPHGAIRLLLIGVLASSAAILHQRGELAGARIGEFFAIVAALVLGHLYAKHVDALLEGPAGEAMDHLKGLGVLAATLYLCASFFDARLVVHERLPTLAAALVSFYFGSRT
jgi:hypothetical protein